MVIEGLDGSGKTEITRLLVRSLKNPFRDKVKLTFEPHDPSCAGLFIREVLRKKTRCSPRTLALAFAANRLDHCDREITPFLDRGQNRIVVCDRYYLSSLVYQTTPDITIEEIMEFNREARRPDLIIFLDTSEQVCLERMKRRAQDKQLFEKNLAKTRQEYRRAIAFLKERGERIVETNADGTKSEVLESMIEALSIHGPDWLVFQPPLAPEVFSIDGGRGLTIDKVADDFRHIWQRGPIVSENEFRQTLLALKRSVYDRISQMPFNDLGPLFLDYIARSGYRIGEKLGWSDLDAFEVEYEMPMNIKQCGTALLIGELQRYDVVQRKALEVSPMSDFMFVLVPDPSVLINRHYERDVISYSDGTESLSPAIHFINREDVARSILSAVLDSCDDEHWNTLAALPRLKQVFLDFRQALNQECFLIKPPRADQPPSV